MNKAVKYTYLTILLNLLIAVLMLLILLIDSENPLKKLISFLLDFGLNLGVGIFSLFFSGYFIAKRMQKLISKTQKLTANKIKSIMIGTIGLTLILIFGIFGGATVAFLSEGLFSGDTIYGAIIDYYFKPFFWILIIGILPTIISGGFLGLTIAKRKS